VRVNVVLELVGIVLAVVAVLATVPIGQAQGGSAKRGPDGREQADGGGAGQMH